MEIKRLGLGDVGGAAPSEPIKAELPKRKQKEVEPTITEAIKACFSMPIRTFFTEDFSAFGVYNNFRMLANFRDGMKPSMRKIVHTVIKKNQRNNIKVASLKGEVALLTHYHHGEDSLAGVICGMAANYVGANNINLLHPVGNHGSRLCHEPAADRYIETRKAEIFDLVMHPDDMSILQRQFVMEDEIEPVEFSPIVPLLLINGSEGMGLGFAQKILPRLPQNMIKAIRLRMENKTIDPKLFIPGWRGFKGKVKAGEEKNQWKIMGCWEKNSGRYVGLVVTELPPSFDHESYLQKLDALVEKGEIFDYNDRADTKKDLFVFEVKTNRAFMEDKEEDVSVKLGIVQTMTENFTCMNGDNTIQIFGDAMELFEAWYVHRLDVYNVRKKYLIAKAQDNLRKAQIKFDFISDLLDDKFIIKGKSTADVKAEMINRYKMPDLVPILMAIPISSQTVEKLEELLNELDDLEKEIEVIKATSPLQMWNQDLDALEKHINSMERKAKN